MNIKSNSRCFQKREVDGYRKNSFPRGDRITLFHCVVGSPCANPCGKAKLLAEGDKSRKRDLGQTNETSRVAARTTKQRSLFERGSAGMRKNPGRLYW
jgi:hypothetical protein